MTSRHPHPRPPAPASRRGRPRRRGVVHVEDRVACAEEARLLRRALSGVTGINAVWDLVRHSGQDRLRAVDIGCGATKQRPWAVGIDHTPGLEVDVIADLEQGLPLASASVDHVFAIHVLEHVRDVFTLLEEIHRVLTPAGVLHVMVPNWRHLNAVADPIHVRFFAPETFRHFCRPPRRLLAPFRP